MEKRQTKMTQRLFAAVFVGTMMMFSGSSLSAMGLAARGYAELQEERIRSAGARAALQEELNTLRNLNDPASQQRRSDIARDLARMEMGNEVLGSVNNAFNGFINVGLDRMRLHSDKERIKEQGQADAVKWREGIKETFKNLSDPAVVGQIILLATGIALGTFSMYYGAKFVYDYAQAQINKPTLVRETSRGSFSLMDLFGGSDEAEPVAPTDVVVLNPEIELKVRLLADDIKQANELGLPYQNVLFYGPPGTGKTECARLLAKYSGMDYAIMSGADFSQFKGGDAIAELHKLFDWAESGDTGTLLFIDEADACYRDRATLDKDGVNFVNAHLSRTGTNSKKFVTVYASNYPDELDPAVRSRIHKKIPFELPTFDERYKIIKLKMNKYVINNSRKYTKDGQEIEVSLSITPDVNDDLYNELAKETEGFSGRDIDQAVVEVQIRGYRSGQDTVDAALVKRVIADKKIEIEKDRKITEYQRVRQQAARAKLVQHAAPMAAAAA